MIVIVLEKCPPALRGDLSKWLLEISLGVYVGKINARVREALWAKICSECKSGRATMVYPAKNEQGLEFRMHNSRWQPVDFDGLKLILRSSYLSSSAELPQSSKASIRQPRRSHTKRQEFSEYAVIDIETTGLNQEQDKIIEIAAIKVIDNSVVGRFTTLIKCENPIPGGIAKLTGIGNEELQEGVELLDALEQFGEFVGPLILVGYNINFDCGFINNACDMYNLEPFDNQRIDVLGLAKKQLPKLARYRLEDVAEYLGIPTYGLHRALYDCEVTKQVLEKLIQ